MDSSWNDGVSPETSAIVVDETASRLSLDPLKHEQSAPNSPTDAESVEDDTNAGEHDEWKDYSCATPWEFFINDVDNAVGEFETANATAAWRKPVRGGGQRERRNSGASGAKSEARSAKKEVVYNGRTYVFRMMPERCRSRSKNDHCNQSAEYDARHCEGASCLAKSSGGQSMEFPDLLDVLGEEECALDALLSPRCDDHGLDEADANREQREGAEEDDAARLLRSWFGLGSFLCMHESSDASSSFPGGDGASLSMEQLLSTGIIAMDGRECSAVLALQTGGNGRDSGRYPWRGASVKGYATLPTSLCTQDQSNADQNNSAEELFAGQLAAVGWTKEAETVQIESETSRDVPLNRQSLEAFGDLLAAKASASWRPERGVHGRVEASARYAWERRLYDGRMIGEGGDGQTEWRNRVWRERSHLRRGARDRAIRALLSEAAGEGDCPVWGPKEDPFQAIRVSAMWRGLGGAHPLPHAPLDLLGDPLEGDAFSWKAAVSWTELRKNVLEGHGSLGFRLRLLLAAYVHCLALGGDMLMADVYSTAAQVDVSSRERARHIGAVLGPDTRDLVDRMRTLQNNGGTDHEEESGNRTDGRPSAEDIIGTARYLLTPRRLPLAYARGSGSWESRNSFGESVKRTDVTVNAERLHSSAVPGRAESTRGDDERLPGGDIRMEGTEQESNLRFEKSPNVDAVPWLWVPRGGAPVCRLVSQVALEAARFGAYGVCLGDLASFWRAFVQEVRFLWEEESFVPRMDPEPPADGCSMHDPACTGQNAALSATFRRFVKKPDAAITPIAQEAEDGPATKKTPLLIGESAVDSPDATPEHSNDQSEERSTDTSTGTVAKVAAERTTSAADAAGSKGSVGAASHAAVHGKGNRDGHEFGVNRESASPAAGGGERRESRASVPQPDMRTCLLHQKLQMLNCCIAEQRRRRSLLLADSSPSPESSSLPRTGAENGPDAPELSPANIDHAVENVKSESVSRPDGTTPSPEDRPTNSTHNGDSVDGSRGAAHASNGGDRSADESSDSEQSRSRKSARLKAKFAMERDVILRRVGVRKENNAKARSDAPVAEGKARSKADDADSKTKQKSRWRRGRVRRQESTTKPATTMSSSTSDDLPPSPNPRGLMEEFPLNNRNRVSPRDAVANSEGRSSRAGADTNPSLDYRECRDVADPGVGIGNAVMRSVETAADQGGGTSNVGQDIGTSRVGTVDIKHLGQSVQDERAGVTFTGERLLVTGQRVAVPELMPPCPLTSDMLEQQRELVRRLSAQGDAESSEAKLSKNRVSRLRLATLSADMMSFLEENPGAVFADFVRWYHPHLWLPESLRDEPSSRTSKRNNSSTSCGTVNDIVQTLIDELIQRAIAQTTDNGGLPCDQPDQSKTAESGTMSDDSHGDNPNANAGTKSGSISGTPQDRSVAQPTEGDATDAKHALMTCRLNWTGHGKIVWGRMPTSVKRGSEEGGMVDEVEGERWMEAWDEAVKAAGSRDSGEIRRSKRPLFNPAQEAEKALHYLETIGPAALVGQLLIALACTAGFLLSEAQTDALELPCVRQALGVVNEAVAVAAEGLCEASASGGVLLMDNRVAHPISQATLRACDSLCDAVDHAEVLLSRATSLLDKLPGAYALVNQLLASDCCISRTHTKGSIVQGKGANDSSSLEDDGEDHLNALARYLSSAPDKEAAPRLATIDDIALELFGEEPGKERENSGRGNGHRVRDNDHSHDGSDHGEDKPVKALQDQESYPAAEINDRVVMPEALVREYILKWRLPTEGAACSRGQEIGARLYARVDAPSVGRGVRDDRRAFDDEAAEVRVAISVAEPGY